MSSATPSVARRMIDERRAESPAMHIVLSASYRCPYRHECSKRATTLEHHFADTLDQLSSPQAVSESRKASKEGPRCHAYTEADRESHLDPIPAAGTSLVATRNRYRHSFSVGCGDLFQRKKYRNLLGNYDCFQQKVATQAAMA